MSASRHASRFLKTEGVGYRGDSLLRSKALFGIRPTHDRVSFAIFAIIFFGSNSPASCASEVRSCAMDRR